MVDLAPGLTRNRRARMPAGIWTVLLLIAALSLVGLCTSAEFGSLRNLSNLCEQTVAVSIGALGQTLVILTGGIDLSIGSLVSLLSVLTSGLINQDPARVVPVCLGVIALGAAVGAANGVLIARLRIHPMIVTLGSGAVLQGTALLYSLTPTGGVPPEFETVAYGRFHGIPTIAAATALAYVGVALFLKRVHAGRLMFAIGDNPHSAALVGLPYTRTVVLAYSASGLCGALAAIYLVSRFGVGQPYAGETLMLSSITPVILGGTLLTGGRGGVMGTLLACYLLSILNNILNFLDVSTYVQMIAQGLVVIGAVSAQFGKDGR